MLNTILSVFHCNSIDWKNIEEVVQPKYLFFGLLLDFVRRLHHDDVFVLRYCCLVECSGNA